MGKLKYDINGGIWVDGWYVIANFAMEVDFKWSYLKQHEVIVTLDSIKSV